MNTNFLKELDIKQLRKFVIDNNLKQYDSQSGNVVLVKSNNKKILIKKIKNALKEKQNQSQSQIQNKRQSQTQTQKKRQSQSKSQTQKKRQSQIQNKNEEIISVQGENGNIYYRESDIIGKGGTGIVYKGYYEKFGEDLKEVAIKKSRIDKANSIRALNVQNDNFEKIENSEIKKYFLKKVDYIRDDHSVYLVLELLEDYMDLFEVVSKNEYTFTQNIFERIATNIIKIVKDIHRNDFIHSDIKLENIMIKIDPIKKKVTERIKLIDIGSIQKKDPNKNSYRFVTRTLQYVSPDMQGKGPFKWEDMKDNDRWAITKCIVLISNVKNLKITNYIKNLWNS